MVSLGSLAMSVCIVVDFKISRGRPDCSMSSNVSIVASYRIEIRDESKVHL